MRRIRAILKFVLLALVLFVLLSLPFYREHLEIGIHSGRERDIKAFGLIPVSITTRDTNFSRLVADPELPQPDPEWHRIHTKGGSVRINYRYAGNAYVARRLPGLMEGISLPDQTRFARAALKCLEDDRRCIDRIGDDGQSLQLRDADTGEVIIEVAGPNLYK